ncbi:hypothetical protein LFU01_13030 [Lysinibacillus fusiformis]|nr:hypothetical protein LFU01_13030 [Lysinibacillus fusiformis]
MAIGPITYRVVGLIFVYSSLPYYEESLQRYKSTEHGSANENVISHAFINSSNIGFCLICAMLVLFLSKVNNVIYGIIT